MLGTIGARDLRLGDDVPYDATSWERVERGERPEGDDLAEAFFHLARIEELDATRRDRHGRFLASGSCLDPLEPPLERLRARLAIEPPRWFGARFAVALTHDVDVPWRWTRVGLRGGAARLRSALVGRRAAVAVAEARALATVPLHKARRSDPWWSFQRITDGEAARGARSTFFVMAGHDHPADGPSPAAYDRLRPRLVTTLADAGAEIGLHASYTAAENEDRLALEKARLEALAGRVSGQRFHYLRAEPHGNLRALDRLGFAYDSSVGFADAPGFRAGIAQPFRPWDLETDRPLRLVEIPLAVMDVTLGENRYLGLSPTESERRLVGIVDQAAERGGGFAVLWHNEWFDRETFRGWDRLYFALVDAIHERGGVCVTARELAEEANAWLP